MFSAQNLLDQLVQTARGTNGSLGSSDYNSDYPASPLSGLFGRSSLGGSLGTALAGAGTGILTGMLMGNRGRAGGAWSQPAAASSGGSSFSKLGGAATLAALAYSAYKKWKTDYAGSDIPAAQPTSAPRTTQTSTAQTAPASRPVVTPISTSTTAASGAGDDLFDDLPQDHEMEDHSRIMLSAMIAAAKADGEFDERERDLIRNQGSPTGDPEADLWLREEIRKPLDPKAIAALATTPQLASEIYLVSRMVIDNEDDQEKAYLDTLVQEMRLDPNLRAQLDQQVTGSKTV